MNRLANMTADQDMRHAVQSSMDGNILLVVDIGSRLLVCLSILYAFNRIWHSSLGWTSVVDAMKQMDRRDLQTSKNRLKWDIEFCQNDQLIFFRRLNLIGNSFNHI